MYTHTYVISYICIYMIYDISYLVARRDDRQRRLLGHCTGGNALLLGECCVTEDVVREMTAFNNDSPSETHRSAREDTRAFNESRVTMKGGEEI